jgi:hypothetical protein
MRTAGVTITWSIGSGNAPKKCLSATGSCVEGGAASRADIVRRPRKPLRVPRREDDLGALTASGPGRLEPDPGAGADHDDGLAEQLRLVVDGNSLGRGEHERNVASPRVRSRPGTPGSGPWLGHDQ